ncbi:MAG TPA: hypothetical protein LFW21_01380, partial [Rickettsia endosymbiont of Pyrocoelia pectoralis]|nr:hypothetical protein [Rickettsia endosymbiont of Pyrocoelia pectoralis]
VCAIATALIVKNGLIRNTIEPIKIKMNNGIPKQVLSIFTYSLERWKRGLNKLANNINSFIKKILFYDKSFTLFQRIY